MTQGKIGTGGLTFEPPSAQGEGAEDIGFAPDLEAPGVDEGAVYDDAAPTAAPVGRPPLGERPRARERPSSEEREARRPAFRNSPPVDDDEGARYPRAWAALLRLLGEPESDLADDGGEAALDISDDHASSLASPIGGFTIGPSIMRATPDVRRPPPEPPGAVTDDEAPSEAKFDDLVEMVLVGGEDGAPPSVHLMFKSDVFGGMILNLERRPEGLFARFQVPDASTRRAVLGRIDDLLVRLRARGLRIAGHEVVVQPIGELG